MMKFLTITIGFILLSQVVDVSAQTADFRKIVEKKLAKDYKTTKVVSGKKVEMSLRLEDVCPIDTNSSANRIFTDYGAIWIAENGIRLPSKCIFSNEDQVTIFHSGVEAQTFFINGTSVTLQQPAMAALLKAREKAAKSGLKISPRGGSLAAKRTYEDTRRLWDTRFFPGLSYWVKRGKLKQSEADNARSLSTEAQVEQVLKWEDEEQIYFSKDFSKSILYSVAAPGASQHISMLALDVEQFADKRVRTILAEYGWFQTVKSDLPHFTYLGLKESELPSRGLKKVQLSKQDFWIPDL